jgi:hypothetical protein
VVKANRDFFILKENCGQKIKLWSPLADIASLPINNLFPSSYRGITGSGIESPIGDLTFAEEYLCRGINKIATFLDRIKAPEGKNRSKVLV